MFLLILLCYLTPVTLTQWLPDDIDFNICSGSECAGTTETNSIDIIQIYITHSVDIV